MSSKCKCFACVMFCSCMYSGRVFFRNSHNLALFFRRFCWHRLFLDFYEKKVPKLHQFSHPKKGSFLNFFDLCSGASRGARGPHPANPKAPQRRPMGAIFGALGSQSDTPNAPSMTQRRSLDLIFGNDELRWSFFHCGGHFWTTSVQILSVMPFFS